MSKIIGLSCGVFIWLAAACALAADGPYYMHADEVNLREAPNGEIILVLELNDKVFIVERDGNWAYVSAPAHEARGWVFAKYVGEGRVTADSATEKTPQDLEAVPIEPAPEPEPTEAVPPADNSTEETEPAAPEPASEPEPLDESIPADEAGEVVPIEPEPTGGLTEGHVTTLVVEESDEELPGKLEVYSFYADWTPPSESPDEAAALADNAELNLPEGATEGYVLIDPTSETTAASSTQASINISGNFEIITPTDLAREDAEFLPVGGHDIALISGSNVNVRNDASLKSEVIGSVNSGDKVYIVTNDDPWYYVSVPAKKLKGWVFGEYVSELPRVEITGDEVRLREGPGTSSRIKEELFSGEVFYEFERKQGWVLCASSASGLKGWVHGDYVSTTERSASRPYKVTGDGVNFRVSPQVDSVIITALDRGSEVAVLGRNDKWSFIEYGGQQGWMYSQYLDPGFKNAPRAVYGKSIGGRLIERAYAMEGTPYVWGGESDSGVDCSGFIYKLLLEEGADASGLPRRASTQMAGLGAAVDKEDLLPGDLVFFTTYKAGASHVGIYLGDGDFIHASSARGKVTISNMSEGYYKQRFVGARRITEDELRRLQ